MPISDAEMFIKKIYIIRMLALHRSNSFVTDSSLAILNRNNK